MKKKTSRQVLSTLVDAGIVTESGQLSARYVAPPTPRKRVASKKPKS